MAAPPNHPFVIGFTAWLLYFIPGLTFPWWPKGPKGRAISYACGGFDIAVGLAYSHGYLRGSIDPIGWTGGRLAVVLLLGFESIQWASVKLRLDPPRTFWQPVERLIYFTVFIGYAEELWFRGICFAQFPMHPWVAVGVGSVLFGASHFNHGVGHIVSAALAGLGFAMARYYGTSIVALAVVHGLVDYLNGVLLPAQAPRSTAAGLGCYGVMLGLIVVVGRAG